MKMIRQLRKHKGLTQQELADLCGLHILTIQKLESGAISPYDAKYGTLVKIASALKVSVDDLLSEQDL